ncbi:hypothetical protein [Desulfothermobacter acidiphilus]|uniref:hypothetical protein n=1 Tax=Desulfothermobacter acidiphilus TaxID=1938353 RepID=UPI003F89BACC
MPIGLAGGNTLPRGVREGVIDALAIFFFLFGERLGREERVPTALELRHALEDAGVSFAVDMVLYAPPHRPLNVFIMTIIDAFLTGLAAGVMHRYREKRSS